MFFCIAQRQAKGQRSVQIARYSTCRLADACRQPVIRRHSPGIGQLASPLNEYWDHLACSSGACWKPLAGVW
eukprot:3900740-Pyramimonas_sp.AAC.1